jgi:hypothetical protein
MAINHHQGPSVAMSVPDSSMAINHHQGPSVAMSVPDS